MEIGMVEKIDIDHEMQQAYLDYAMSVIVARALPDARDGLKPVHRRILYAMYDMGLRPDGAYKKSARIVGEVLGKYHPHGDMAVYETMARMAQDFSMRYTLVDGQGNFGSIDGDPPAAMRYTEARLTAAAIHMITDIDRNTVDFNENFDGTLTEPEVMPAAVPNLLVNGATGIAVGMATSIPPHNLIEIVDALQYMLEKWEHLDDVGIEELIQFVKGPDFPTGGVIIQSAEGDGLIAAYTTGRGRVTVQASAHLEEMERGRNRIIVTELPYMTNKSSLIERIADLARGEKIEGIVDLRDESDRQGMRIVIELSKNADPDAILRDLYKHTPMQSTFSIIMLALVNGEPRHLSLKQALHVFLEHRLEVIRRRSEYELNKARARAHILEGLRIALQNLDEIIALIRKAPDVETARTRLMKRFKLSEVQAQAILDMPLRRLAALERKKIEEEYKDLVARIKQIEALLKSPKKMRQAVGEELQAVKEAYGDRRRTHIVQLKEGETKASLLTKTDLLEEKEIWISISPEGLISRSSGDKPPRQSGREAPKWLVKSNTRDTLYLAAENGETAAIPVHALPETDETANGVAFHQITPFAEGSLLAGLFSLPPKSSRADSASAGKIGSSGRTGSSGGSPEFILTATRQGMLKKTTLGELPGASAGLFTLVKVNDGDQLGWLQITNGKNEILLVTATGMAIRFSEEAVRPMGLVAAGVMGIKLQEGDALAGMDILPKPGEVFLVSANGKAKRVGVDQFPVQGRYGQGVTAWKLPPDDRVIGLAVGKGTTRATLHINKLAPKMIRLDEAPLQTRAARGGVIQEIKPDQHVTDLTIPWEPPRPDQPTKPSTDGSGDGSNGGRRKSPSTSTRKTATNKANAGPAKPSTRSKAGVKPSSGATKAPAPKASTAKAPPAAEKPAAKPSGRSKAGVKPSSGATKAPAPKTSAAKPPPAVKKPATKPSTRSKK